MKEKENQMRSTDSQVQMLDKRQQLLVKMETQVNTARLVTQPQQKLQLNYKTTIIQNCQKIKLHGSPTRTSLVPTKELKKSHSFRQVGGVKTQ